MQDNSLKDPSEMHQNLLSTKPLINKSSSPGHSINRLIVQIMAGDTKYTNEFQKLIPENEKSCLRFLKEISTSAISILLINGINFAGNFINAIMIAQSTEPNILEAANFISSIGTAATLSSVSVMFSLTSMVANDYGNYLRIENEKARLVQFYQKHVQSESKAPQLLDVSSSFNSDTSTLLEFDIGSLISEIKIKITESDRAAARQLKRTGESLRSGWIVATAISIPTTLSLAFAVGPFLKFVMISERIANMTQSYFQASSIGVLGLVLTAASTQFVIGINKGSSVILPALASLFISVGVGYSLKYIAGLGLKGLGYADSVDAWMSSLIYWLILFRKDFTGNKIYKCKFNWQKVGEIFRKGTAIAFSMLVELGPIFGMSLMAGHYSSLALSAQNVAVQYNNITYLPIITANLVANQLVGKYRGAKFYQNTRRMGYHVVFFGIGVSSLLTLVILGVRRQIVSAFVHVDTPDRDALMVLSEKVLTITAFTQALDCARIVTTGALQGIKDVDYLLLNSIITLNFIALPLSALLCFTFDLGAEGIAYGHGLAMLASSISLLHRWGKKSTSSVLENDLDKENKAQNSVVLIPSSSSSLLNPTLGQVSSEEQNALLLDRSISDTNPTALELPDNSSSFWSSCWRQRRAVHETQNVVSENRLSCSIL